MKTFLAYCRYLLIIPVIGCILLTTGVVIMGTGRIITASAELWQKSDFSAKASKTMATEVIEIIDLFLVGTVAYIAAIGLYKLFIDDGEIKMPIKLKIESLNDLENKIIGVLIAALAVAFLGQAAGSTNLTETLYYGGGIALVIAALTFFLKGNEALKK